VGVFFLPPHPTCHHPCVKSIIFKWAELLACVDLLFNSSIKVQTLKTESLLLEQLQKSANLPPKTRFREKKRKPPFQQDAKAQSYIFATRKEAASSRKSSGAPILPKIAWTRIPRARDGVAGDFPRARTRLAGAAAATEGRRQRRRRICRIHGDLLRSGMS
jgi:hypothetical protein